MQLEKVTIKLFVGDKDKLKEFFPQAGYNKVIREFVRKLVRQKEEEVNQLLSSQAPLDIEDIDL